LDRADSSLHAPGFVGVGRLDRDAAPATSFGLRRDVLGLPTDSLFDHPLGNLLTDLDGEFLDVGELGPPGDTPLAVDATIQLFGEATQEVLQIILDDRRVLDACHPWLLSEVATHDEMEFKTRLYLRCLCCAKMVVHPKQSL
jgi:hypothetical protein